MPVWAWLTVGVGAGVVLGVVVGVIVAPRVCTVVRSTPPPDLPEHLAPGWYARCTRCGRTRTLARVGGVRLGGNPAASKVTLGWCRACRGLRVIQIVHGGRLADEAVEPG